MGRIKIWLLVLVCAVSAMGHGASSRGRVLAKDQPSAPFSCTHCTYGKRWSNDQIRVLKGVLSLVHHVSEEVGFQGWFGSLQPMQRLTLYGEPVSRTDALQLWRRQMATLAGAPAGASYPQPSPSVEIWSPILSWRAPSTKDSSIRLPRYKGERVTGGTCPPDRQRLPVLARHRRCSIDHACESRGTMHEPRGPGRGTPRATAPT